MCENEKAVSESAQTFGEGKIENVATIRSGNSYNPMSLGQHNRMYHVHHATFAAEGSLALRQSRLPTSVGSGSLEERRMTLLVFVRCPNSVQFSR